MKIYQAPWGKSLTVTSASLVVLAMVSLIATPRLWPHIGPAFLALLVQCFLSAIVLGCLPFMIRGYAITEDAILIRRLFWTTRLERRALQSAEVVTRAMKGSLRTCGNAGIFSYTGWYWSKALGNYRAFVSDLNRTVVLRFETRTVVVSPDQPEDFVNQLRA